MMKLLTMTAAFAAAGCLASHAQNQVIRLYEGKAPGSESWTHSEQESAQNSWNTRVVFNVADPTLTVFKPDPAKANGTAVIICPTVALYNEAVVVDQGQAVDRWQISARGRRLGI